jgi:2-polyprenyl-6-hydroxyphenyl methylase/3-demethylubiquinone-9 3-methyltransferase
VLDPAFLAGLGQFDLVYSWGVLHHTGAMWPAIELAQSRVVQHGTLLFALYNDQGWCSQAWHAIKRLYCSSAPGRWLVGATFYPLFFMYALWQDMRHFNMPGTHAREYARKRGMSIFHDWRDWLGGYPFEVAKPEEVVRKLTADGFELKRQTLTHGLGCNEFVFVRCRA